MLILIFVWGAFVWLLLSVVLVVLLRGNLLLACWREWVLACPVVIVESDDWGVGPPSDGEMLTHIATALAEIRDETGHPAVMTLGVVLGAPDGGAILASACQTYVRRTLVEPEYAPIVRAMRAGCESGVFSLQRHGLEHCWPDSLLARARQVEASALRAWLAAPEARTETLPSFLQSRWVATDRLPSSPLPVEAVEDAIRQESALFASIFGTVPGVAVPNTFVWDGSVEAAWAANGVTCVVTPGTRYPGRDADGKLMPPVGIIWNGRLADSGLIYVVRDDYFEPIQGHRAEGVWRAVAGKTHLGRPTLLETHRESFIGPAPGRDAAVAELARALRGVRDQFPNVRFMNTENLAKALADPGSLLREKSHLRRGLVYVRRLMASPGLSRLMKVTGLVAVLWLAEQVLAGVTGDRSVASPA